MAAVGKLFVLQLLVSLTHSAGCVDTSQLWTSIMNSNPEYEVCLESFPTPTWNTCYDRGNELFGGNFSEDAIPTPNMIFSANTQLYDSSKCYCDKNCIKYSDCCKDIYYHNYALKNIVQSDTQWSCTKLPGAKEDKGDYIYMLSKCSPSWTLNDFTRQKCELKSLDGDYLQFIPVNSKVTNIMYKNVYCAACNFDSKNLEKWNVTIGCEKIRRSAIDKDTLKSYYKPKYFNPELIAWEFPYKGKVIICNIQIQEFQDGLAYADANDKRICKPNQLGTCPIDFPDEEIAFKCGQYTSYLFGYMNGTVTFKNFNCMICNSYFGDPYCSNTPPLGSRLLTTSSFNILFDFNLASGNSIGQTNVRKCGFGELYDSLQQKCVAVHCGKAYILSDEDKCVLDPEFNNSINYLSSECKKTTIGESEYEIFENKVVFVKNSGLKYTFGEYEFNDRNLTICVERVAAAGDDLSLVQGYITDICLCISILFLSVHIFCYAVVKKLRNLPGKNLLSLSTALLVSQILFVVGSKINDFSVACKCIAILMHFSLLGYFLWMSVMAFDICHTFRGNSTHRRSGNKTFVKYSVFAWVVAASIVVVAAVVDSTEDANSEYRPGYGEGLCWMSKKKALIVFFVVPVALVMIINISMFIMTAISIKQSEDISKHVIKRPERRRYYLYIKLAVVMGLTWTMAFAAAVSQLNVLWLVYILFNALQGCFIFFAFSFKRKVWNLVKEAISCKTTQRSSARFSERSNATNMTNATGSDSKINTLPRSGEERHKHALSDEKL